jgi:hypothetical protein
VSQDAPGMTMLWVTMAVCGIRDNVDLRTQAGICLGRRQILQLEMKFCFAVEWRLVLIWASIMTVFRGSHRRILERAGNFSLRCRVQTGSGNHPASCAPGAVSPGIKRQGRELITHLHSVPRLRMRGTIFVLPPYVFMAWYLVKHRGTLPFVP